MNDVLSRVAGAPISWGVCEVPGWGHQMRPARVLSEMSDLGLMATELGPDGFLPAEPAEVRRLLRENGMELAGAFVPVLLADADHDPVPDVRSAAQRLAAAGSTTIVLAAATGLEGYDERPVLDVATWRLLLENLDRSAAAAADAGLDAALHPHVGTLVERLDEVDRVLDGCDIGLCVDTGHLLVGGADPAALTARAADRVTHVHLKDVHAPLAEEVRAGRLTYSDAVRRGLYRPLGEGDVAIDAIVQALEASGYQGWYVLEQDTVLTAEPAEGSGPWADVEASLAYLRKLVA